jgi:hypothetical protein
MTTKRAWLVALVMVGALAGCMAPGPAQPQGNGGPALPTPQASLSLQVEGTAAVVRQALAQAGLQLNPPIQPYRPSEPAGLAMVPRAVLQENLADPDQGYVIIYEFPDVTTATDRGRELATYLGSGFGQTNYPLDAQFAITQVGGTIVFTWWSKERSSNDQLAEAGFNAVASVGQPIPVLK